MSKDGQHILKHRNILQEALNELLLEAMSLDDIHAKYYSDIDRDTFKQIVSADPTSGDNKKGKYTEWLLKLYKTNRLKTDDLYKATEYLEAFHKFKNRLNGVDLNHIKSLPELYDVVKEFIDDPDQATSKSDEVRRAKAGADKMYEDARWLIVTPHTKEAAIYYGKGTQWCTAATKSQNYFDTYVEDYGDGCLFINIDKINNRKYQFCFDTDEYMDETDKEIKWPIAKEIGLTPGVIKFYERVTGKEQPCFTKSVNSSELTQVPGTDDYFYDSYISGKIYAYNKEIDDYELLIEAERGWFDVEHCLMGNFIPYLSETTGIATDLFDLKKREWVFDDNQKDTDGEYIDYIKYTDYNTEYVICQMSYGYATNHKYKIFSLREMKFILSDDDWIVNIREMNKDKVSFYRQQLYRDGLILIEKWNIHRYIHRCIALYDAKRCKYLTDFIYNELAYAHYEYGGDNSHSLRFFVLHKDSDKIKTGDSRADVILYDGTLIPKEEFENNKKMICGPYVKQFAPYLVDDDTNEGMERNTTKGIMMEALEELLLEDSMSLDDVYEKHYAGKVDRWSFDQIVHYDPTSRPNRKGRFTPWLLQMYMNNELAVSDLPELKGYLEAFAQIKGVSINKFKTVDEFKSFVQPYIDDPDLLLSKSEKERRMKALGAEKVYEDNEWLAILLKKMDAAIYYGKGTKWCTAATEATNLFDSYHRDGDIYVNINKQTREKYQFFFRTNEDSIRKNEFKNAPNEPVTNKDVGLSDGLIDFYISKYDLGLIGFLPGEAERIIDKMPDKEKIYTPEFLRNALEKHWNEILRIIITGDFVIPEYVNLKGDIGVGRLFKGCTRMTSVTIPECFTEIPSHTFNGCTNLREVHLPNTMTKLGFNAFSECTSLTSISIPDSVTEIDDWCFDKCINLETVNISNSVEKIGKYCFSDCSKLSSITIPISVKSLGEYAFTRCVSLQSVRIPVSIKEISKGLFYGCEGLTSIEIPNGIITIDDAAFEFCTKLKTIVIPESVRNFGIYMFLGCSFQLVIYVNNQEQYNHISNDTSTCKIKMIQDEPVQNESRRIGIYQKAFEEILNEWIEL